MITTTEQKQQKLQKQSATMEPAGAVVAHKTGTSGTYGGLTRATNDVGLITLPNGRHLAFTSNRSGKTQVYTIARDGKGLKQVTTSGNSYTPDWSK